MEDSVSLSTSLKYRRRDTADEETTPLLPSNTSVDRGWAWMALAGCCLCNAIFVGQASCIGVLYVDIRAELDVSVTEVSVIGSLRNGFLYFIVIITSPLSNHVGCRRMALTGGILASASFLVCYFWTSIYVFYIFLGAFTGFASAMTYAATVMTINNYFDRKRSFGLVMAQAAGSSGILVFSPFTSYLLGAYGLHGTLLINAAIALNIVVGAMLIFPLTKKVRQDKIFSKKALMKPFEVYKDKWIWKNPLFYLMLVSSACNGFSVFIPVTLFADFMVSQGISLDIASLSVSVQGATMLVSRFLTGVVLNSYPRLNRIIYIWGGVLGSVFLYLVPVFDSATEYIMASAGFGLFYGCLSALMSVNLVDLFSSDRLPASFGVNSMAFGTASLVGSPIASAVAESSSLTGVEFVIAAAVFMMSGLVMIPSLCANKKPSDDNSTNLNNST